MQNAANQNAAERGSHIKILKELIRQNEDAIHSVQQTIAAVDKRLDQQTRRKRRVTFEEEMGR